MGKRRKMPEDLMGTILSKGSEAADEERAFSESRDSPGGAWNEGPERVGVTFNLSKQVATEIERLRRELRVEGDVRPSRSEVAEAALRIAVEDAWERGNESELAKRLGGRSANAVGGTGGGASRTTRLSVDEAGFILETTYDESGEVVDEDVLAAVADLPVAEEYVDDRGRLVSVAKDGLGNTFEQVMDEDFNTLETRLLTSAD
ncbi:MAG: hypothetical protein M3494_14875 [Actinomycetota bacterium]|jgi:hypothetical protein|nr:hypothetical protein [Actinomycetota bacterium]